MKKFYLIFCLLLMSLIGAVFAIPTIEAPIGQTTDVVLGYGRSVIINAVGGFPPYSFQGSSCVTGIGLGSDDKIKYTGNADDGSCTTTFYDLLMFQGYVDFTVTCVCDYCTTSTDESMSASDDGISFEEIASGGGFGDPGDPDDNAMC